MLVTSACMIYVTTPIIWNLRRLHVFDQIFGSASTNYFTLFRLGSWTQIILVVLSQVRRFKQYNSNEDDVFLYRVILA